MPAFDPFAIPALRLKCPWLWLLLSLSLSTRHAHAQPEPLALELREQHRLHLMQLEVDRYLCPHPRQIGVYTKSMRKILDQAWMLLLSDQSHPESPLALAQDAFVAERGLVPESKELSSYLISHLDQKETLFRALWCPELWQLSPPENGESQQSAWVFFLRIPSLSDHLFWIVIPKDKETAAYVYGFN